MYNQPDVLSDMNTGSARRKKQRKKRKRRKIDRNKLIKTKMCFGHQFENACYFI